MAFNQALREVGREFAVPVIDLAREVPPKSEYLYDSVHFNAKGSALAAAIIARSLERLLREGKVGGPS